MYVAYTDGACTGNPGPGGWGVVLLGEDGRQELSGGAPATTNNRMELTAVIEALRHVPADAPMHVVTDSEYVMKGMTQWLAGWRRRGWRTSTGSAVLNRELWETLAALAGARVTWEWVRGHTGHPENERADALARAQARAVVRQGPGMAAAARGAPPAFGGSAGGGVRPAAGRSASVRAAPPADGRPTYLSLVDGELRRHADWPACQAHTHGRAGARFKKCRTPDEERATVRGWGVAPEQLAALERG